MYRTKPREWLTYLLVEYKQNHCHYLFSIFVLFVISVTFHLLRFSWRYCIFSSFQIQNIEIKKLKKIVQLEQPLTRLIIFKFPLDCKSKSPTPEFYLCPTPHLVLRKATLKLEIKWIFFLNPILNKSLFHEFEIISKLEYIKEILVKVSFGFVYDTFL